MPVDTRLIVESAMRVRGAAPQEWSMFVDAVTQYSVQIAAEMVKAPPELLLKAQGMAVACTEIAGLLRDAPQLMDKFKAAQMARPSPIQPQRGGNGNVSGW